MDFFGDDFLEVFGGAMVLLGVILLLVRGMGSSD
jgi:hypothetical protein